MRELNKKKLPLGALLLEHLGVFKFYTRICYQVYIMLLTFFVYTAYHMSRKPFSVVASVLAPGCENEDFDRDNESIPTCAAEANNLTNSQGWPPFNSTECKTLIGAVDYAWLFTYAVFLVGSGIIADRVSLRYFLTVGMMGSGIFVGLLGVAYFGQIHSIVYFIIIQIFVGVFESTGWPGTVAVMGNWFGKKNRGLVLGIWNAHTSVGNILGTAVPAVWADSNDAEWGWSFLVPGFVMIFIGAVVFLFLVTDPTDVGLSPPNHHLEKDQGKPDEESLLKNEKESRTTYNTDDKEIIHEPTRKKAVGLITALKVPGVIEYSMALFFTKLVSYTFLFWLPYYVFSNRIGGVCVGHQGAALLATLFDVGGIAGSISTGLISDLLGARAISCVLMTYLAVPTLFLYRFTGLGSYAYTAVLILLCGLFINGPYALITTAVSNDLGTHKALKDNQKAKATVGGIIDAAGSLGAAFGPLITGTVSDFLGWDSAFYVLMCSCFLSSLMLSRLLLTEIIALFKKRCYVCCRN